MTGAAFHHVVTPKSSQDTKNGTLLFEDDLELIQGFVIEFALGVLFIFAFFTVFFPPCTECCQRSDGKSWKIGCIYTLCVMIDVCVCFSGLLYQF